MFFQFVIRNETSFGSADFHCVFQLDFIIDFYFHCEINSICKLKKIKN